MPMVHCPKCGQYISGQTHYSPTALCWSCRAANGQPAGSGTGGRPKRRWWKTQVEIPGWVSVVLVVLAPILLISIVLIISGGRASSGPRVLSEQERNRERVRQEERELVEKSKQWDIEAQQLEKEKQERLDKMKRR